MTDYNGAIDYFVDESRVFIGQNHPETIVIHGTGGSATQTAQELGDYFRTNSLVTSVHFGVDRAGTIAQYVLLKDGAGGNCCTESGYDPFWQPYLNKYGNLNLCSIEIEHVNDVTNSLPLTPAQQAASFKLIAYLSKKYNIAPDHIKSHASIAPQSRAECPGAAFPWNELWNYLKGENTLVLDISQASQYFINADSTSNIRWHCKQTGFDVAYAILVYYQTCTATGLNGLSQYGLPTSAEQPLQGVAGGTFQMFERGVICYDPAHAADSVPGVRGPCYPGHIDRFVKPATPINVDSAITILQTIQTAVGGVITKLKG